MGTSLLLDGDQLIYAVGESYYQEALLAVCGVLPGAQVAYDCVAVLVPEPTNRHDPNAVTVLVEGRQVAYLSREDAVTYRSAVQAAASSGRAIACHARIAGRGQGASTANLGIFLKLPSAEDALTEIHAS